ncbi:4'-phosphopantetheinyl transferase family protein [Pseudogemmobacter faecipullorum]|uniref:Enterobactin synthase component D n=1 Tax=Pseudogemmobacter faecipullorum TaxID=2755041 RepID=A0ABS8CGQ2_9RHOB|nr:4'-phosphopantetheinyl transferase superfamily protein [Pseudogemmobacter faecipullorum]MCB5408573.1 phosphopantetheinyl transferase [Pseudogemmobacter faecipullorum]
MPDRLLRLESTLAGLLPPGSALASADPKQSYPLLPGEEAGAMIAKRAAEFSAGRYAARLALARLGEAEQAIPRAPDRAPCWPEGIRGSITHSREACLAAVTREGRGLGLDLELARDFDPGLISRIAHADDQVTGWPEERHGVMIFSAKEAAYKAQYPLSQRVFGFEKMAVRIEGTRLVARFREGIAPFAAGEQLTGRITLAEGHVLSAVWL